LINTLEERTFFGGLRWNLEDNDGRAVTSGIYLYEIRHQKERKLGKVVVVR
jgi:hypothetical protein